MIEDSVKAYVRRVAQANRSELIVILYDIILEDVRDAGACLAREDWTEFCACLVHAAKFVKELMVSLDMTFPVSKNLMSLYIYVSRCLNYARIQRKKEELDNAVVVLSGLHAAFTEISRSDGSDPLMERTQKLYAGLTYGKGSLNETVITGNEDKRGFYA